MKQKELRGNDDNDDAGHMWIEELQTISIPGSAHILVRTLSIK